MYRKKINRFQINKILLILRLYTNFSVFPQELVEGRTVDFFL